MQAAALGSDEYERAGRSTRINLWILAGLLAFSMYNQLQYLAQTWTPPHTPLTPPGPFAYLVRAIITPSAFMAAAFLAPIGEGMAAQVQWEAHALARLAFKAAAAKWKRRRREMQQQQQDVTGALVGLIDDPGERRVVAGIWQAMHLGETLTGIEAPAPPAAGQANITSAMSAPARAAPAGPGSPSVATARTARSTRTAERPAILRITPDSPPRRAAARGGAGGFDLPEYTTGSNGHCEGSRAQSVASQYVDLAAPALRWRLAQ
jgi:hypothetical protein